MHIKLFFIEIDGEQAMTLDKVCKAFEDWRANRSSQRELIPERLWMMVRALLPHYHRSKICAALHLSGGQFKQHCLDVKIESQSIDQNDGFIETLLPMQQADCEITLQGTRKTLRMKIPPQQLSVVLPLLEAYL
jgi:surfactin synthase thioesterase subunit